LFALLSLGRRIDVEHLVAAMAAWEYCAESVARIFAGRTGTDAADRIRAELFPGQEMTLSDIRQQIFSNHISAGRLRDAVDVLETLGDVRLESRVTGGRSAIVLVRLEASGTTTPDVEPERAAGG